MLRTSEELVYEMMWQPTFRPEITLFIDDANRELQESVIGGLTTFFGSSQAVRIDCDLS